MFGSAILDVAIGLILVYLLMSLLASAVREGLEAWLKTRASDLERGIRELLHDRDGTGLTAAIYSHPLVSGMFKGNYLPRQMRKKTLRNGDNLPSYIPASNFAMALLDAAARGTDAHDPRAAGPDARPLTLESVRSGITQLQSPIVQRALLAAIDAAEGNLAKAQENVEAWFNGAMDRVSGWYKRRTQWILLLIGIVLSVAMNVNSIGIATALLRNAPLRQAVVAQAEKIVADSAIPEANFQKQRAMIDSLGLPIGWGYGYHGPPEAQWGNPDTVWGLLTPMVGWLLTAFAVTLGAPFWFDLLNKVMVIRSTVKPHEKSPEEASEDRQARTSTRPPTLGANQLAGVGAGTGSAAAGGAASGAIGGGTGGAAAQPPSPAEAFEAHEWADGNPQEGLI